MTQHALVTIVAPMPIDRVPQVRQMIGELLGNPANKAFRDKVSPPDDDAPFLHFASLHALEGSAGDKGYIILEFSADGDDSSATGLLAQRTGELFKPIFAQVDGYSETQDIAAFWRDKTIKPGFKMFNDPGITFAGTPGMSVREIRREKALSKKIAGMIAEQGQLSPLQRLKAVRRELRDDDEWAWALDPLPPASVRPAKEPGAGPKIKALLPGLIKHFLWPLLLVTLLFSLLLNWPTQWVWEGFGRIQGWGVEEWIRVIGQLLGFTLGTLGLVILFSGIVLGLIYAKFRRLELTDETYERSLGDGELEKILERENMPGFSQNHMISHTVRKAGWLRRTTNRLAFFAVATLTGLNPRVGFLGDIGTIHFARWITIPGTRDFVFFSNYGGSWESYLEDFITKAHEGLTAVWSNAIGFPRSNNLFQDGATDGERFKRYARQSMLHTPFWYCAYPELTTFNIRANHQLRRGLSEATGDKAAVEWLALFGSQPRPVGKLESSQMQSLLFGGMGFKPDGKLMLIDLSDNVGNNKELLGELMPYVAFGDGRYYLQPALVTVAPSGSGLTKLGLPQDALSTFPPAFRAGMSGPGRSRVLGDIGTNAPENWWWGKEGHDIALLVYGDALKENETVSPIDMLDIFITEACERLGATITRRVDLTIVADKLEDRIEPFGFVDGVSQPAMRGTYRGRRNDDPIHLIEPGEMVLGYPDNRGKLPPVPLMDAAHDPDMHLPVAGKDEGFEGTRAENPRMPGYNGSFLVIRQLEQHVDEFRQFCKMEGDKIKDAFPEIPVTADMSEFVAAKMIGRWQDGSSLVRNPYISARELKKKKREAKGEDPDHPLVSITPDNDFLFGTEDPQGIKCPFGSHIRRTNPRESMKPGVDKQIEITNRHRILRVGRGYLGEDGETTKGLMFMCLNADLERQFEFIQQTWMQSTKFHGLDAEADPIAVNDQIDQKGFTIPTRRGPVCLGKLPQFVTMRGGGYFFVPGRQLLEYLSSR